MPDAGGQKSSFWTSLPGILTGVAALITAVVGAAAYLSSHHTSSDQRTRQAASDSLSPTPGVSAASTTASGGKTVATYTLRVGDFLDLDTGMVGSAVSSGDLNRGSSQLNLYGRRNAIVSRPLDRAGCVAALQQRSDGYAGDSQMASGLDVCVATDHGAIAFVKVAPPAVTGELTLTATVWH